MQKSFKERYHEACEEYKKELQEQVDRGEISQKDANIFYAMGIEDILYEMQEE